MRRGCHRRFCVSEGGLGNGVRRGHSLTFTSSDIDEQRGSTTALVSCPQECHQIQAGHLEEQQVAGGSVDGAVRVLCAWQENERGGKFSSLQDRRPAGMCRVLAPVGWRGGRALVESCGRSSARTGRRCRIISQRGYSLLCLTPAAVGGLPPAREGRRLVGGCSRDVAPQGSRGSGRFPCPGWPSAALLQFVSWQLKSNPERPGSFNT